MHRAWKIIMFGKLSCSCNLTPVRFERDMHTTIPKLIHTVFRHWNESLLMNFHILMQQELR